MADPIVSRPDIRKGPIVASPTLRIGQPDFELMATVLPNGRVDQWLRFTVLISPRLLVSGPAQQKPLERQFSYFRPIFNWPAIRSGLQFQVVFDGAPAPFAIVPEWESMPAPQNVDPFDANLWAALFPDTLLVRPYQFDQGISKYSGDKYLIVAPPEKQFIKSVKADLYANLAVETPDRLPKKGMMLQRLQEMNMVKPVPGRVPGKPGMFKKGFENPELQLNILQERLLKSQLGSGTGPLGGALRQPGAIGSPGTITPRAVEGISIKRTIPKMSLQELNAAGMTEKEVGLLKYHAAYEGRVVVKPRPAVPTVDFHQLVSSLGDYPELMKRIGFRVDLRVQSDSKIPPNSRMSVKVLAPPAVIPKVPTPRTQYLVTADAFRAATSSPELQDGLLTFGRQAGGVRIYDVVPGDVEGAFKRIARFSELLLDPKKTEELEEEISLPALRSAGLSVAHNERDQWLDRLLDRNKAMSGTAKSAIVFAGEDLIRGYRIDVREVLRQPGGQVAFGPWRSLCFRHGEHRLGANPAPILTYDDEGWISLGATEGEGVNPVPKVGQLSPKSPLDKKQSVIPQIQSRAAGQVLGQTQISELAARAAVGAIQIVAKPILHIYESMFRWAGWSLCVPRPGKDLNPGDNPDYSGRQPIPGIPMQVFFQPVPGTLPRLRFGKQYQFRARVVDLAGNSLPVTFNPSAENPLYVTDVNDGYHDRFEPVSSPILVLTAPTKGPKPAEVPLLPGDFASRLVIRTINLETPQEVPAGPATAASMRHLVPPRVSQELAEQHGVFDTMPLGQAYQMMTDKDLDMSEQWQQDPASPIGRKAVMSELPEFVVPLNQNIEVPYLPDPLAAGVSFYKLPGSAGPAFVVQQLFAGSWPRRVGFKIQIEGGNGAPVFQGDVLKVFVPQGEHIRAQASCFFQPGAENLMGLWRWIEERLGQQNENSPMSMLVRQGRHWLLTPSRELNLVHALQQPLFNPLWASLFNPLQATQDIPVDHVRRTGDTHAYLYGTIAVHRGSTEEFDVEARWSEAIDTGVPLTDPPQRMIGESQAFQVPVIEQAAERVVARGVEGQEGEPPLDIDLTERGIPSEALQSEDLSSSAAPAGSSSEALPTTGAAASGEVTERAVPLTAQVKPETKVLQVNPAILAQPVPQGPPPYDERPFRCATQLPPLPPNLAPHQYRFAGKQKFLDTKYRCVDYVAIGKTRYRDYFLPTREEEQEVRKNYEQALANALAQKTAPPPPPALPKWTRSSQPVKVDILNSAPPAKPEVLYIMPTFRWEETPQGRRRNGGGLRVYLDRPWFSSGDGEQLAVILFPQTNAEIPDNVKPYVTQWGLDPLWEQSQQKTGRIPMDVDPNVFQIDPIKPGVVNPQPIQPRSVPGEEEGEITSRAAPKPLPGDAAALKVDPALLIHQGVGHGHPTPGHFRNEVAVRSDLGIREVPVLTGGATKLMVRFKPMPVTVSVFDVKPDVSRQLWYCDIEMDPGTAYFPFVRLALARYQVNSIAGMHLSPVVQADFAQLVPDRLVSVTPDPKNSNGVLVSVTGVQGYASSTRLTVAEASLEEANPNVPGELGWVPVANSAVKLASMNLKQWVGSVVLPPASEKVYRLVVKEFEQLAGKETDVGGRSFDRTAGRLVYCDAVPIKR